MTNQIDPDDLLARVDQFHRLELPGQPQFMHMGTSYLVSDLWREVQRLQRELAVAIQQLDDILKP